jgi:glucosyl-3-phosphoglycerate synthase
MIAGRKQIFQKIQFRDGYGVDIGLLIDMHLQNIRIKEVDIGYIENKSKPWQALGKMSKEVAQTIISKASLSKNPNFNFEELGVMHEIRSQMEFALESQISKLEKLVVFDMDNTLLKGRFIDKCAEVFGFREQLWNIRSEDNDTVILTKRVANLLKGRSFSELIAIADSIPVVDGAKEVVDQLKSRGYIVGIISDSYDCITTHVKNKLGMHFSLSQELEFSNSICTGEMKIPSFLVNHPGSLCRHALCKSNAMLNVLAKYNIKKENCIAIGDSMNDLCIIKEAGMGIAFCSKDELVNHHADMVISDCSFEELLEVAK